MKKISEILNNQPLTSDDLTDLEYLIDKIKRVLLKAKKYLET